MSASRKEDKSGPCKRLTPVSVVRWLIIVAVLVVVMMALLGSTSSGPDLQAKEASPNSHRPAAEEVPSTRHNTRTPVTPVTPVHKEPTAPVPKTPAVAPAPPVVPAPEPPMDHVVVGAKPGLPVSGAEARLQYAPGTHLVAGAPAPYSPHGTPAAMLTDAAAARGAEVLGAANKALPGNGAVLDVSTKVCPDGLQMDANEVAAMDQWMGEGAAAHGRDKYSSLHMEWGTGGSTLHNGLRVGHVYAVEHHEEWCAMLARCFKHLQWDHITPVCAPLDTRQRDFALSHYDMNRMSEGGALAFANYVNAPFTIQWPPSLPAPVILDSILVDGRARIACALRALAFMDEGTALIIHDANREKYRQRLAPYFDFQPARDCVGANRGICRLRPLPHLVGKVLPDTWIRQVAELRNFQPGAWTPIPLPQGL